MNDKKTGYDPDPDSGTLDEDLGPDCFQYLIDCPSARPYPSEIYPIRSWLAEMHWQISVHALSANGKESWKMIQARR